MSEAARLPGADRVDRGLRDLTTGSLSTDALLVAVAAGRLRALGVPVRELDSFIACLEARRRPGGGAEHAGETRRL